MAYQTTISRNIHFLLMGATVESVAWFEYYKEIQMKFNSLYEKSVICNPRLE